MKLLDKLFGKLTQKLTQNIKTAFAACKCGFRNKFRLVVLTKKMPKPPYREAQLVNDDKPLTERWYIVFYCWRRYSKAGTEA